MNEQSPIDASAARARMLAENERRRREIPTDRYAPWNPAEQLFRHTRRRLAARLLHSAGAFPDHTSRCLELGCGTGAWMSDLISWGVAPEHAIGAEIDLVRLVLARRRLPGCQFLIADGSELAVGSESMDLVVLSTVLSSVLEPSVQRSIAREAVRALRPKGALLCYDFRFDNPNNRHVRGVTRQRLGQLFGAIEDIAPAGLASVTLAPPIARRLARWPALAELLEGLPFLRTHQMAVYLRS